MKSTNLNIFVQLGSQLQYFIQVAHIGQEWDELFLFSTLAKECLGAFLEETAVYGEALQDSRASAQGLLDQMNVLFALPQHDWKRPITQAEYIALSNGKDEFEKNFEREHKNIDVFTVTPKGIYNTRLLMEHPERQFPDKSRAILPAQMVYDLKQAGRCLAFDIPTACAFHVCRGTEALMLAYYGLLARHPWSFKKKDWKIYIEQLIVSHAPAKITNRLEEIRLLDRNAYIHPDMNVSLEEAQVLFGLCAGVNSYMAEEVVKLSSSSVDLL
jgi:hypothetical protein